MVHCLRFLAFSDFCQDKESNPDRRHGPLRFAISVFLMLSHRYVFFPVKGSIYSETSSPSWHHIYVQGASRNMFCEDRLCK